MDLEQTGQPTMIVNDDDTDDDTPMTLLVTMTLGVLASIVILIALVTAAIYLVYRWVVR